MSQGATTTITDCVEARARTCFHRAANKGRSQVDRMRALVFSSVRNTPLVFASAPKLVATLSARTLI